MGSTRVARLRVLTVGRTLLALLQEGPSRASFRAEEVLIMMYVKWMERTSSLLSPRYRNRSFGSCRPLIKIEYHVTLNFRSYEGSGTGLYNSTFLTVLTYLKERDHQKQQIYLP
jgi:hypothetical protein